MDRVNIPGEAPGSATYYMGFAPEEYGARLYEMEHYGDAKIHKALMDIGSQRTEPYKVISSSEEYEDLVELPFEDHLFYATSAWDKNLSGIFGDYMQLPPEAERITHNLEAYRL